MEKSPSQSEDFSLSNEEKNFNFETFSVNIKKSITVNMSDAEDVELESYLLAYEQLENFFLLLGTAFKFVAKDVREKIKILKTYQNQERQSSSSLRNFSAVKKMISYEKEKNLLKSPNYVSGSRTLLRLHRGLDFLRKFLGELYSLKSNADLGPVARNIYDKTLAEHHTWIVRSTARVAMQFLPNREELLNKISDNKEEVLSTILDMFPEALEAMNTAYDRIQNTYSSNGLLELP